MLKEVMMECETWYYVWGPIWWCVEYHYTSRTTTMQLVLMYDTEVCGEYFNQNGLHTLVSLNRNCQEVKSLKRQKTGQDWVFDWGRRCTPEGAPSTFFGSSCMTTWPHAPNFRIPVCIEAWNLGLYTLRSCATDCGTSMCNHCSTGTARQCYLHHCSTTPQRYIKRVEEDSIYEEPFVASSDFLPLVSQRVMQEWQSLKYV